MARKNSIIANVIYCVGLVLLITAQCCAQCTVDDSVGDVDQTSIEEILDMLKPLQGSVYVFA